MSAAVRPYRPTFRSLVWPLLAILSLGYFGYHLLMGHRGLLAWSVLRDEVAVARSALEQAQAEQKMLERKVALLRRDNLDQDMLDEQVRHILGYAEPDEYVVLLNPVAPQPPMLPSQNVALMTAAPVSP